ncbi:MAG: 3-hydroxybutyrate oligomer hydrolase family protein [Dokdonella sp.]
MTDFLTSPVRETSHEGSDDLLTAGLGLAGLRGALIAFADPQHPTPQELRRRAIQSSWKGIADLGPLGRYGELYGSTAAVAGREFQAFALIPGAKDPHRVLLQAPDNFDAKARCLVVTASSGSRGIYGPIALAGAIGLPRGCAVAYTDKGTGSGYFDSVTRTGVALDGTRARAGDAQLEFEPTTDFSSGAGIAVKHAHSQDNPEADWGRHVLQAAHFGLAMLDRAYPQIAPFTVDNTRVIALGLSNGGGAVLRAAGEDDGLFDAVIAVAPNVNTPGQGRALYDYVTEAAIWMPCALLDSRFDVTPFARLNGSPFPLWQGRCASLIADGRVSAKSPSADALAHLHASGWTDAALGSAAASTQFDLWRAVGATYASTYLRTPVGAMPCGFRFDSIDVEGTVVAADMAQRAAWWSDASGIPPGAGVGIFAPSGEPADPTLASLDCLGGLWTNASSRLHEAVDATRAELPREDLPIVVIHGAADGLIPMAFSGGAYVEWLRQNNRSPNFWPVTSGQHFDAFLAFPGFGDRHVPLLPYAHEAFDKVLTALIEGRSVPTLEAPKAIPRGPGALDASHLGLR